MPLNPNIILEAGRAVPDIGPAINTLLGMMKYKQQKKAAEAERDLVDMKIARQTFESLSGVVTKANDAYDAEAQKGGVMGINPGAEARARRAGHEVWSRSLPMVVSALGLNPEKIDEMGIPRTYDRETFRGIGEAMNSVGAKFELMNPAATAAAGLTPGTVAEQNRGTGQTRVVQKPGTEVKGPTPYSAAGKLQSDLDNKLIDEATYAAEMARLGDDYRMLSEEEEAAMLGGNAPGRYAMKPGGKPEQIKGTDKIGGEMALPKAPPGYTWNKQDDGSFKMGFIAGGPHDPKRRLSKKELYDNAEQMAAAFRKDNADMIGVGDSYSRMVNTSWEKPVSTWAGTDDVQLLFTYAKALDPGSVFREGEQVAFRKTSGALEEVKTMIDGVMTGRALSDGQRVDFSRKIEQMYNARRQQYGELKKAYGAAAERQGHSPEDVLYRVPNFPEGALPDTMKVGASAGAGGGGEGAQFKEGDPLLPHPTSAEEKAALPSGAEYIAPDGTKRRKP